MKYILFIFFTFLFILNSTKSYGEDALTVKQQIDRIMEEVKDLNKAVFNKSFDKDNINSVDANNETERFTSIDIRIYDLEKDIKNLTLQFEEILFKLDDLSKALSFLENEFNNKINNLNLESKIQNIEKDNFEASQENLKKEENTLGKIIISDQNQSTDLSAESNDSVSTVSNSTEKDNNLEQELDNFTPEELMQFAFDHMMKKNYDKSKNILNKFIEKFPENKLTGSAHFWLGKIYLFEKNYRKAAIVFGEGVQKFPKSIKAPEMYYELAKSLNEMNKFTEACKTLKLLEDNYEGKYTQDPEKIKAELNCEVSN